MKDAKSGLVTSTSCVWTKTYAAGFWIGIPSVAIAPRMAAGVGIYVPTVQTTGTAAAGYTVTVTFAYLPKSTTVVVGGTVATSCPGAITFDMQAFEPN